MVYATEAEIRSGAERARIRNLTQILFEYGCVSRIEWSRRVLVLELPEDAVAWIVTGGFAELLDSYDDCVAWRRRFLERSRHRAPLPPPAGVKRSRPAPEPGQARVVRR
jgi:hypothetical protein